MKERPTVKHPKEIAEFLFHVVDELRKKNFDIDSAMMYAEDILVKFHIESGYRWSGETVYVRSVYFGVFDSFEIMSTVQNTFSRSYCSYIETVKFTC